MEKKKLFSRRGMKLNLILILLLLLALLAAVFAWLYRDKGQQPYTGVSNFNLTGDVYFETAGGKRVEGAQHLEDGLLQVDVSNPAADNYLGNLRVDVTYKGYSPAYIRVRMIEQWIDEQTDTLQPVQYIPYLVGEGQNWFDNRQEDLCFYYQQMVSASQDKNVEQQKTLRLIEGVEEGFLSSIQDGAASLYLTITVDGVQPNRYQQFWNISKLPWEK